MAAPWYTPSGTPATNAQGSSADIRTEFNAIETAMDLLPALTADNIVVVNAGGTALTVVASLSVGSGGTGATSLTDGGVLLGSGTGAITAMAVLADGEMIVGDGTTDPVAESGATLRTSIGLGTGDLVTFGDITLAAANPEILGGDTDGTLFIAPSTTNALGGNVILYGDTHATKANDIEFRATAGVELHYDDSASLWDFQANTITTTGPVNTGNLGVTGTFTLDGKIELNPVSTHFQRNR